MYVYMYVCVCMYVCTYVRTNVWLDVWMCGMHACLPACLPACVRACMHQAGSLELFKPLTIPLQLLSNSFIILSYFLTSKGEGGRSGASIYVCIHVFC